MQQAETEALDSGPGHAQCFRKRDSLSPVSPSIEWSQIIRVYLLEGRRETVGEDLFTKYKAKCKCIFIITTQVS